jgi:hypothetical protein
VKRAIWGAGDEAAPGGGKGGGTVLVDGDAHDAGGVDEATHGTGRVDGATCGACGVNKATRGMSEAVVAARGADKGTSTALWPTSWLRSPGCINFSRSSIAPYNTPPSSTATTSARSTSPLIPCTSARSTWRSTCTSYASVSPSVTFGFSASQPRCSSPTSSTRGYCRVLSLSFNPVSTSIHDRVETTRGVRIPLGF